MNKLDTDYQNLLKDIMTNGIKKSDRTGTGTISVFGRQIRHNMKDGFPLLTTKKMAVKTMMTELKWFLKGDTNIKYLVDNGCNIWNGDAYKRYSAVSSLSGQIKSLTQEEFINQIKTDDEFAKQWGELGPIYGAQWRKWFEGGEEVYEGDTLQKLTESNVDQIHELITQLKNNPDSRRLMVSAWNVAELNMMVLPPCHYGFQVYTRELSLEERGTLFSKTYPGKSVDDFAPGGVEVQSISHQLDTRYNNANIPTRAISLMWNQRSVDTFLGLPFNIASYGTLLLLLAETVGMVPEELIGNLGDVHLYSNHIEQATEQCGRRPYNLPKLEVTNCDIMNGKFEYDLTMYEHHPTIKAPLSN